MTTHYLKIALRNMRRFKFQTVVCLTGLAVGMTCFALGTLWLRHIESFEDFVPEAENVCLVTRGFNSFDGSYDYNTSYPDGEVLQNQFAEIADYCTVTEEYNKMSLPGKDGMFNAKFYATDNTRFFQMFGIKPEEGSLARLNPGELVLTRSLAKQVFGDTVALGQRIVVEETNLRGEWTQNDYFVTAVIPDAPQNTQFSYEVIFSPIVFDEFMKSTSVMGSRTFVRLHEKAQRNSIVGRMLDVSLEKTYTYEDGRSHNYTEDFTFLLAPIREARTNYLNREVKINTDYVRWFMAIGLLVIACSLINYLITMVSHLRRRAWELSLRRVLGSSRVHIIYMVALETLVTLLLAAALGYALTLLVLPEFREYSGIDIPLQSITPRLLAYLGVVIAGILASSVLTAWIVMWRTQRNVLSSRQLTPSLQGRGQGGEAILQMSLSMALLFAVTIILRQIDMIMYSDDLGFAHQNLVNVYHAPDRVVNFDQFPLIEERLDSVEPMFPKKSSSIFKFVDNETGKTYTGEDWQIDTAYYDFYHMRLLAGRLPQKQGLEEEYCVNESFCEMVGMTPENIVGRTFDDGLSVVCGVLQNAYIFGPTKQPAPTAYMYPRPWYSYHVVRTQPGRAQELIDTLRAQYPDVYCINVEEDFEQYIQSEQMLIKILLSVGGASLFVCVIGTFSLVSLGLQSRRKEIAIRKVHGAKMRHILRLFLRSHLISLGVAAIIAYPIAFIIMKHWLEGYQKQVAIGWWLIIATFLAIAAVVLLTITLKIWSAAREKTVEALNG